MSKKIRNTERQEDKMDRINENETEQTKILSIDKPSKHAFLSAGVLKMIAVITMLIDHVGHVIVGNGFLLSHPDYYDFAKGNTISHATNIDTIYAIYRTARTVGRMAFPIYAFFIVIGFMKTRNVYKYACRIGIFALLSEIPFDLAFNTNNLGALKIIEFGSQNVLVTFFIAIWTLIGIDYFGDAEKTNYTLNLSLRKRAIIRVSIMVVGMWLAYFLKTDYSFFGVLLVVLLYSCRYSKPLALIMGAFITLWEASNFWVNGITTTISFVLLFFYNGKKGINLKYFFYAFYPVHLLVLAAIQYFCFR